MVVRSKERKKIFHDEILRKRFFDEMNEPNQVKERNTNMMLDIKSEQK